MTPDEEYRRMVKDGPFWREHDAELDRNCLILELARHNGYSIETFPTRGGELRLWNVPREFGPIAGAMVLLVR